MITANPIPTSLAACWHSVDGLSMCVHKDTDVSAMLIYLSISVFLVIEAGIHVTSSGLAQGPDGDDANGEWDFLARLFPLDLASATQDGLVYDIVGCTFSNGSHFISRYRQPRTSNIFDYDSMKHNGFSQRISREKLSQHLAGKDIPMPSGYRTHSVVYRLHGGLHAQQTFYCEHVLALKRLHGIYVDGVFDNLDTLQISLIRRGLTVVPDCDRAWHSRPKKAGVTDYNLESGADQLMAQVGEVEQELFSDSDCDLLQLIKRKHTVH